jgi:hypothetical protein
MIHVLNQLVIGFAIIAVVILVLTVLFAEREPEKKKKKFKNAPQDIWLRQTLEDASEIGEFYRVFLDLDFWESLDNREFFRQIMLDNPIILNRTGLHTMSIIFHKGTRQDYDYQ